MGDMIPRALESRITERIQSGGKVVIVYGARQVGKTTLVENILNGLRYKTLKINADESRFIDMLASRDLRQLRTLVAGFDVLFVDEAQRIPEIGINLKLLVDNLKRLRIIVTGSSSLDLASKVQEPLTGRAWLHQLYPISTLELAKMQTPFELREGLDERLIFGSYPEIFSISNHESKREYLETLVSSYLYKDILELGNIRNPTALRQLLKLLAYQIGHQVSLNELGAQLAMSKETVANYIDLLEKSFVVFRVSGFSRNLRKEVSKQDKIYFWDVGVRNAIIENLKRLEDRVDAGEIWENFVIAERKKKIHYQRHPISNYYWRTYGGAELDIVEDEEGQVRAYECKWGTAKTKVPESFATAYPSASFETIRPTTFVEYLT
jgi:hypothetical protein